MFQEEGWKRIISLVELFERLNINIDDTELLYERITHPFSTTLKNYETAPINFLVFI